MIKLIKANYKLIYPIIMSVLLPFVVVHVSYESRLSGYIFAAANSYAEDDYLYVRSILFAVIVFIGLINCRKTVFNKGFIKKYRELLILLVVFIISTIFSGDTVLSVLGCDEQFEGIFILVSYVFAIILTGEIIKSGEEEDFILDMAGYSCICLCLIAFVQRLAFGLEAYMSLYNSNYAGQYMVILFVVFVEKMLENGLSVKKLVFAGVTFAAVLLSGAKTAAVVGGIVLTAALLNRYFLKIKQSVLCTAVFASFFVFTILAGNFIGIKDEKRTVNNVETLSDGVVFYTDNGKLRFCFDMPDERDFIFTLYDEEGSEIPYKENADGTMYVPADEKYSDYAFSIADYGGLYGFLVYVDGRTWYFCHLNDGEYYYLNGYTRPDKFIVADSIGFDKNEDFATNRGYIWSRSIPLLFSDIKSFLIGNGPDTFPVVFPQNDVNKYLKTDFQYKTIITKPHNMYLKIWTETGVFSIILLGIFLVKSRGKFDMAVLTYLLTGIFYDQSLCVMIMFCTVLGIRAAYRSDTD